jgi:alpha-L-fucosidase
MVKAACYNANFLLNVGPMPDGTIQPEFTDTLALMGKWLQQYGATVYGTRGAITTPKTWGGFTQKDKTVYMHILQKQEGDYIFIPELKQKIKKATSFDGKTVIKFKQQPEGTFIYLSGISWDTIDTILELQLQ